MKNTLLILTLALSSMTVFAGTKVAANQDARKAAIETCKSEGKKDLKACVKEKLHTNAPAAK